MSTKIRYLIKAVQALLMALGMGFAGWAGAAAPAATAAPGATPAQAATPAVADDYIIGAGDSLQIFVFRNPELSGTVPVRPDGKITTQLVEDMVAEGKSPSQLARDIEAVLAEFILSPQVNVIVGTAVSTSSQVQVIGEVREPKALPYRAGLRVLDVVLATGGLTDFAAPNRSRILREQANGKTVETPVKLGDLLNKGDLKQNHALKAGDVLIIPKSRF
jgi:polysaccharide biosynthesis/export protein